MTLVRRWEGEVSVLEVAAAVLVQMGFEMDRWSDRFSELADRRSLQEAITLVQSRDQGTHSLVVLVLVVAGAVYRDALWNGPAGRPVFWASCPKQFEGGNEARAQVRKWTHSLVVVIRVVVVVAAAAVVVKMGFGMDRWGDRYFELADQSSLKGAMTLVRRWDRERIP